MYCYTQKRTAGAGSHKWLLRPGRLSCAASEGPQLAEPGLRRGLARHGRLGAVSIQVHDHDGDVVVAPAAGGPRWQSEQALEAHTAVLRLSNASTTNMKLALWGC